MSRRFCAALNCGGAISRRNTPGFPCSGSSCDNWFHINCAVPVVELDDVDDLMIGKRQWFCAQCASSTSATAPAAVDVTGSVADVSLSSVLARLERAEAIIEAQEQELSRVRVQLANLDGIRTKVRALEIRLDTQAFWSMTSMRPSFGAAAATSVSRRENGINVDLQRPLTSSPISHSQVNAPAIHLGSSVLSPVPLTGGEPPAQRRVRINPIPMIGGNFASGAPTELQGTHRTLDNQHIAVANNVVPRLLTGSNTVPIGSAEQANNNQTHFVRGSSTAAVDFVADPAVRLRWIFATGFKPQTNYKRLLEYIDTGVGRQVDARCYKLTQPDRQRASFKIGLPEDIFASVVSESFWPNGVTLRDFRFLPRTQPRVPRHPVMLDTGTQLEEQLRNRPFDRPPLVLPQDRALLQQQGNPQATLLVDLVHGAPEEQEVALVPLV